MNKQSLLLYRTNMLVSTNALLLILIAKCTAYNSQWVPNFYLGTYPEKFQTLRMTHGSCIVSLDTFKSNHFNVEIPLINGSIPAGFCAILLNTKLNLNLAIAVEQGLTNINNSLLSQDIKLFKVKNGNVKLVHDVRGSNDIPGLALVESNTAILLIKADQRISFSLSIYTINTSSNSKISAI